MKYVFCFFALTLAFLNVLVQFTAAEREPEVFYSAAISPDGKHIALGQNGAVSLETDKSETRRILIQDNNATVNTLAFSHGGQPRMLALGTSTGAVYLHDVTTEHQKANLLGQHDWGIVGITIAANRKLVVSASEDGNIKFWNVQTKQETFSLDDYHDFEAPGNVTAVALSPDGTTFVLGATPGASLTNGTLQVWKISRESLAPRPKRKISIPERTYVTALAFSPDNKFLAVGTANGTLFSWEFAKLTSRLKTINKSRFGVTTLAFSLDSQIVVVGTEDGEISFWDPYTAAKKKEITPVNTDHSQHSTEVLSLAFSDDGKVLTSVDTTRTTLSWNLPVSSKTIVAEKSSEKPPVTIVAKTETRENTSPGLSSTPFAKIETDTVQKSPSTAATPVSKTTPASKRQSTATYTTALDTSTTPSDTSLIQREENDPRITFINYELNQEGRFYNTTADSFRLEVYVIDDSRIPSEGVKIERRVEGGDSRTYAFIANAAKKEGKYVVTLPLAPGTNEFRIAAEDEWSNIERQSFTIVRTRTDMEGPRVEVTQVGEQTIRFPEEVITLSGETVRVRGSVEDRSGIRSVTVNGTAALVDNGSFEANVPLNYAENTITIRATNLRKQTSQDVFSVYQRPNRVNKDFALFFPTDTYSGMKDEDGNWTDLHSTIRDAEVIAANLRDNYGFETRIFENCTREQLLNTIYAYNYDFEGIKYPEGSQLLIYFSGHGNYNEKTEIGYLIAADTKGPGVEPAQSSALDHRTLRTHIDVIACDRILVLLDTCASGPFDPGFQHLPELPLRNITNNSLLHMVNTQLKLDARWCLTAAGVEYAVDGGYEDNSPFAKAFLKALNTKGGDDSLLNLDEVWTEVHKSKEAEIYHEFKEGGKIDQLPEPRKGQFGKRSFNESDFLFFPIR